MALAFPHDVTTSAFNVSDASSVVRCSSSGSDVIAGFTKIYRTWMNIGDMMWVKQCHKWVNHLMGKFTINGDFQKLC